jgi:hypothetical protein
MSPPIPQQEQGPRRVVGRHPAADAVALVWVVQHANRFLSGVFLMRRFPGARRAGPFYILID